MNLRGQVGWEVLSVENSEGEGQLNSTVGYVSSGYSLSGCYLTVESLMRCELSHTKIYMPWVF